MGKRLESTPRSRVRSTIRALWLRSRERAACLKAADYTCRSCGRKQSKARGKECNVEVHHINGIHNWDNIIDEIYAQLLVSPNLLEVLCEDCHKDVDTIRNGGK